METKTLVVIIAGLIILVLIIIIIFKVFRISNPLVNTVIGWLDSMIEGLPLIGNWTGWPKWIE